MEISYKKLNLLVAASGWDQGLNLFLDQCGDQEYTFITRFLKNRLTNLKLFLDLSRSSILVVDDSLGTMTNSLSLHCKGLVCCDNNWHKLALLKKLTYNPIQCVNIHDFNTLPFSSNTFNAVLIINVNNDSGCPEGPIKSPSILKEFSRVLKPDGQFLFFRNRKQENTDQKRAFDHFFSQSKKKYYVQEWFLGPPLERSPYEAVPDKGWANLRSQTFSSFGRLKDLVIRQHLYPRLTPHRILISQKEGKAVSTLKKIITVAEHHTGVHYRIEKVLFLSSTLLFLEDQQYPDNGLIIRIPYHHEEAEERCQRNFTALKTIKQKWPDLSFNLPKPIYQGRIDNVPYFIEDRLPGIAFDTPCGEYDQLLWHAAQLSADIFKNTSRKIEKCLPELEIWLTSLTNLLESPLLVQRHKDIKKLKLIIHELILDNNNTICLCHGDFKLENILVHKDGSFAGLIDWDLHVTSGLPFLDLYSLLLRRRAVYKGESNLQSIHSILQADRFDKFEKNIIGLYMEKTQTNQQTAEVIGIIYWLHIVSCKMVFSFLKHNKRWFHEYISKPLDTLLASRNKKY